MATKLNGSAKRIGVAMTVVLIVFGFGTKSKSLEKDIEANATSNTLIREDIKEIKADVKVLLSRP